MKVRVLTSLVGNDPDGVSYSYGPTKRGAFVEMPTDRAKRLIMAGHAEEVETEKRTGETPERGMEAPQKRKK